MPAKRSSRKTRTRKSDQPERCDEESAVLDEKVLRSKLTHLSAVDLFRDLTPQEIEEIDRATTMRSCKAGRVFYTPGETGEVLFILKEGEVEIFRKSSRGRRLVIARLRPYSFFGEMSCIGHGMYERYAIATEDSLVCTMKRRDVERLLLSKPRVALRLLEAVGKRMIDAERRLEDFAFKQLAQRIASFLLREAETGELRGMRHQDIADKLGVFRETVTEALDELKAAGIIEMRRMSITIIDRGALKSRSAE